MILIIGIMNKCFDDWYDMKNSCRSLDVMLSNLRFFGFGWFRYRSLNQKGGFGRTLWLGLEGKGLKPHFNPFSNDNATLIHICLQIAAWAQKFPPRIWAFDKNYATSSKQCYGPYIFTILITDFYYHHFILSHHNLNHVLLNKESQTYQSSAKA